MARPLSAAMQAWVDENQGKHLCSCGCGQPIKIGAHHRSIGVSAFISGHNFAPLRARFVAEQQGKHFCACGCGEAIKIKQKHADPKTGIPLFVQYHHNRPAPLAGRFWQHVAKGEGENACWLWTGAKNHRGYGKMWAGGRDIGAHRIAYAIQIGPIPQGMFVCHRCDVPACVRGGHLFLGTCADNHADCVAKGRSSRGAANGMAKLDNDKVRAIRSRRANGERPCNLAREFGVSPAVICAVALRRTWRHVPPV